MEVQTTFFVFNEIGLITQEILEQFVFEFRKKSKITFLIHEKEDLDLGSSIFIKLVSQHLEVSFFDYGYVIKVEGEIIKSIQILQELDSCIGGGQTFYLSPTQKLENTEEGLFPRGLRLLEIAEFLNMLFSNKLYTNELITRGD